MQRAKWDIYLAVVCLVIAMAAAFYAGWQRLEIEVSHKQSAIVLDWTQVRDAANREGRDLDAVLTQFSPYVAGVAFKEFTIADLITEGKAAVLSGAELAFSSADSNIAAGKNYVLFADSAWLTQAKRHIEVKASPQCCRIVTLADGRQLLEVSLAYSDLTAIGVGFDQKVLQQVEAAGLQSSLQIRDYAAAQLSPAMVDLYAQDLAECDILTIGFNDNTIPGVNLADKQWKEMREAWRDLFYQLEAPYTYLEFFSQAGSTSMGMAMDNYVLRLHSISETEMRTTLTRQAAVDRLQLAASERSEKALLVRMVPGVGIDENVQYMVEINRALWDKGIVMQAPAEPVKLDPQPIFLLLAALGVTAGAYLLYRSFPALPRWLGWALFICAMALAAALLLTGRTATMQKLFAFVSVIVFPSLALIKFTPRSRQGLIKAILLLIATTAFSLIGALLMIGLLADGDFMLGLQIFKGVKLAHLLPIVIVGCWFFFVARGPGGWRRLWSIMKDPVTLGWLVMGALAVAVIGYYLLRTGNSSATAVSSWERGFRSLLDELLYVRPRTKEFAFGHPLLLILYYYGYQYRTLPLLLLASIGQISLVNTFAHIHTPLTVSLLRTLNGLWLGIVAGIVAIVLINFVIAQVKKRWPLDADGMLNERVLS